MANLADVLEYLNGDELRYIVDALEIASPNRKVLAVMRQAILDEDLDPAEVLSVLTVDELKWIAEEFDLPTSGRKAEIIDRILSADDDRVEDEDAEEEMEAPRPARPRRQREPETADYGAGEKTSAAPAAPKVGTRTDVDLSIFQAWLQGALNTGRVSEGQMNYAFCRACSRKHPRRWFNYQDEGSERSFYLCYAGEPIVVESLKIGSKQTTHSPTAYAKQNELNERFTQEIARVQAIADDPATDLSEAFVAETTEALVAAAESQPERSFLSKLFGSGVQAGGHLVRHVRVSAITSTPPFVEVKIDMEHVQAAIQKGKDSWNS